MTAEDAFSRWLCNHPELQSKDGFTCTDHDKCWHRFRTDHGRDFQLMMILEIKNFGAVLSESQRDTLYTENQLLRNRRQTPTKQLQWQAGIAPLKVWSTMRKRYVWVRHFGVHVLRFSDQGPEDSEWIEWDRHHIDCKQLLALLKFDLDPDTLQPMDGRSHHRKKPIEWLMDKLF